MQSADSTLATPVAGRVDIFPTMNQSVSILFSRHTVQLLHKMEI